MTINFQNWLWQGAAFVSILNFFFHFAHAADPNEKKWDWVERQFIQFKANPRTFSQDHSYVTKHDPITGAPLSQMNSHFSKERILSKDFILDKDAAQQSAARNAQRKEQENSRAAIAGNDRPEDLIGYLKYTSLKQMQGLMSGSVATAPWSDDYWPIYKGEIAARYTDPNFPENWGLLRRYFAQTQSSLNDLSPAEKYDLIVGDVDANGQIQWNLTHAMLSAGEEYYRSTGTVETWMGICHGWTPASIAVARPSHAIRVLTSSGVTMDLYPSDVKALLSLLWANSPFEQRFISGRCNEKKPPEDRANGRIRSQNCFDTNPGTWHQVVVNQIGHQKKSFILDATWDYEVWNQPAYAYQYIYFNPKTGRQTADLKEAAVPTNLTFRDSIGVTHSTYREDPFAYYRSEKARYLVGVAMTFVYVAETAPSHNPTDDPSLDRKVAVNYLYDLETDENFKILGGEWYHHEHPDFVWMPAPGAKALSIGDANLNGSAHWDGFNRVPPAYTDAARYAAQSKSQPLAAIVNTLAARSQLGR